MKEIRVRYQILGGHVHCRVFMGPAGQTLGKCGDLTFTTDEFEVFKAHMLKKPQPQCAVCFLDENVEAVTG